MCAIDFVTCRHTHAHTDSASSLLLSIDRPRGNTTGLLYFLSLGESQRKEKEGEGGEGENRSLAQHTPTHTHTHTHTHAYTHAHIQAWVSASVDLRLWVSAGLAPGARALDTL